MKIRRYLFPRTIRDICATTFLFACLPTVYWFELWIVLPSFHATTSFYFIVQFSIGSFILFNIISNWLAVILCDTSISGRHIIPPDTDKKSVWKVCAVCECVTPPRSWHCNTCRICILKRDHHCIFTGCCIGHHNHRYFVMLVFYLFIGTVYASIYNNVFIWILHGDIYRTTSTFLKIIFPLAMFVIDTTTGQYYLLIYMICMIGAFFTGFLLWFHLDVILRGDVTHDRGRKYNLGYKRNLEMVFGTRLHLIWISPFLKSELPHDGINWDSVIEESNKNR